MDGAVLPRRRRSAPQPGRRRMQPYRFVIIPFTSVVRFAMLLGIGRRTHDQADHAPPVLPRCFRMTTPALSTCSSSGSATFASARSAASATKFHRLSAEKAYSCQHCAHHMHPMVGTPFEQTHMPLQNWFYAMYLFTATRHGVSAKELQRQFGCSYKSAWRMGHEIRKYLAEFDGTTPLDGQVEVDETYVGGKRKGKRGRGAAGKTIVVGHAGSERRSGLQGYPERQEGHADGRDRGPCRQGLDRAHRRTGLLQRRWRRRATRTSASSIRQASMSVMVAM